MRGMSAEERITMESGSGMVRKLVPSLLHHPHAYPIVAALYILVVLNVVLIDTKILEQHASHQSPPMHPCFLFTYPCLPSTR